MADAFAILVIFAYISFLLVIWNKRERIAVLAGVVEKGETKDVVCRNCGAVGSPMRIRKGGALGKLIEICLWIFLLSPIGLIWSVFGYFVIPFGFTAWRNTYRYSACRECGDKGVLPLDSPVGKQLQEKFRASRTA